MAYDKNTWVDQSVERPRTYEINNNADGSVTLVDSFGLVSELGTPVNAVNMNHIEEGIEACELRKYSETEVFNKNEWVTAIVDGEKKVFQSRKDDNLGHSVTETDWWEEVRFGGGGGLEVGDIGLALYIDETKGKRRYLNGSILQINTNTQRFVNYLKSLQTANPNLFTTEANWQAAAALNVDGCVYQFVINETAGTVRLPKYPSYIEISSSPKLSLNIAANIDVVGNGNALGLISGNGTTQLLGQYNGDNNDANFRPVNWDGTNKLPSSANQSWYYNKNSLFGVATKASDSGLIGKLGSSSVQGSISQAQTKLKMYYYIQIATGSETEVDIVNEIEFNNPFYFGMSQYSEQAPENLAWLKSSGQWNSCGVYADLTKWIEANIAVGKENFKTKVGYWYKQTSTNYMWLLPTQTPKVGMTVYATDGNGHYFPDGTISSVTSNGFVFNGITLVATELTTSDWFSDYDWVLDTENQLFRLPLLDGSESLEGNTFQRWDIPTSGTTTDGVTYSFRVPVNATVALDVNSSSGFLILSANDNRTIGYPQGGTDTAINLSNIKANTYVTFSYRGSYSINTWQKGFYYIPYVGNGDLYFYVGETVQNANLIDAGRLGEQLASKADISSVPHLCAPSSSYTLLTMGASGSTFTAPNDGQYFVTVKHLKAEATYFYVGDGDLPSATENRWCVAGGYHYAGSAANVVYSWNARKGQKFLAAYTAQIVADSFKFKPCVGAVGG